MAAKTREFAQKTHGKYELIHIRSGWANVLGRHDAATSKGEPLAGPLAPICEACTSNPQLTFLHMLQPSSRAPNMCSTFLAV